MSEYGQSRIAKFPSQSPIHNPQNDMHKLLDAIGEYDDYLEELLFKHEEKKDLRTNYSDENESDEDYILGFYMLNLIGESYKIYRYSNENNNDFRARILSIIDNDGSITSLKNIVSKILLVDKNKIEIIENEMSYFTFGDLLDSRIESANSKPLISRITNIEQQLIINIPEGYDNSFLENALKNCVFADVKILINPEGQEQLVQTYILTINSNIEGGNVTIDGISIGNINNGILIVQNVTYGNHTVTITFSGGVTISQEVNVTGITNITMDSTTTLDWVSGALLRYVPLLNGSSVSTMSNLVDEEAYEGTMYNFNTGSYVNNGLLFNNSLSNYISIPLNYVDLKSDKSFSISLGISDYNTGITSSGVLGASTSRLVFALLEKNGSYTKNQFYETSAWNNIALPNSLWTTGTHDLTVTFEEGYYKLYFDGVLYAQSTYTTFNNEDTNLTFVLGKNAYSGVYSYFNLKYLNIYPTTLSIGNINQNIEKSTELGLYE